MGRGDEHAALVSDPDWREEAQKRRVQFEQKRQRIEAENYDKQLDCEQAQIGPKRPFVNSDQHGLLPIPWISWQPVVEETG